MDSTAIQSKIDIYPKWQSVEQDLLSHHLKVENMLFFWSLFWIFVNFALYGSLELMNGNKSQVIQVPSPQEEQTPTSTQL